MPPTFIKTESKYGTPSSGTDAIPITRPFTPSLAAIESSISQALRTGMLTTSRFVQEFERRMAEYLEVDEAVAVSNCTTGLVMTLSVLGLSGEILVPSFTFSATGHACVWAGLEPVFVDCDQRDWTVSLADCMEMKSKSTCAVLAVHVFGNPADVNALEEFSRDNDLVLVFDAAHALGSRYAGKRVGSAGTASVFSLTPTKIVTSGEGGIITTNDRALAKELRIFRNYGDDGSYDCTRIGLNGRMSEFNAILGLATLGHADEEVQVRNELAQIYKKELAGVPGVYFQEIMPSCFSSYKDFTILIDEKQFGATRDDLAGFLSRGNIATKKYFYPPLHEQSAYRQLEFRRSSLTHTTHLSRRALTLPMFSRLSPGDVFRICGLIESKHEEAASSNAPTVIA